MPSIKNTQKAAVVRARAAKTQKKTVEVVEISSTLELATELDNDHDLYIECMGWTGGVNYVPSDSDSDDGDWKDTDWNGGDAKSNEEAKEDLENLEGGDLLDGLWKK